MAEHEAERDDGREPDEGALPGEPAAAGDPQAPATADSPAPAADSPAPAAGATAPAPVDGAERGGGEAAFDEDAAWAAIVAGYGEEPPDPPGARPFRSVEDLALPDLPGNGTDHAQAAAGGDTAGAAGPRAGDTGDAAEEGPARSADKGLDKGFDEGHSRPLGGSVLFAPGVGPRDHRPPAPGADGDDPEDHFVPPEPPPLPSADTTAKFAWLAVIGGPVVLLLAVLLGWQMTWWLSTVGIGGFLGGFATLVARMRTDEDDDGTPGSGAVV